MKKNKLLLSLLVASFPLMAKGELDFSLMNVNNHSSGLITHQEEKRIKNHKPIEWLYSYKITIFGDSHIKQGDLVKTATKRIKPYIKQNLLVNNWAIGGTEFGKLHYNIPDWKEKSKNSDLIIIAYGTNESFNDQLNLDFTKKRWIKYINYLKQYSPNAKIVLVIAGESIKHKKMINQNIINGSEYYGRCGRAKKLDSVINMQKDLVKELNLYSWSISDLMGGSCTMLKWKDEGLASKDLIHFSKKGYVFIGEKFADYLIKEVVIDFIE